MKEMRLPSLVRSGALAGASLSLVAGLACGCASTMSNASGQDRVVVAVDNPPSQSSDVQITEMIAPPAPEVAPPRRRLSQTVTLGQESYAHAPPAQPQANGQGGTNVIVNNNVTVVNQPPVVYGGGYYGGYGGYGGGYAPRGYAGTPIQDTSRGSHQAWAPNGWEGAGRTAAPGATPRIGGNFSPPPSPGPRAMK